MEPFEDFRNLDNSEVAVIRSPLGPLELHVPGPDGAKKRSRPTSHELVGDPSGRIWHKENVSKEVSELSSF